MGMSRMATTEPAGMAGSAVTASVEVLTVGTIGRDQRTVAGVTGRTSVVDLRISTINQRRWIKVTSGAAGAGGAGTAYGDQRVVARGVDAVCCGPSAGMTGRAVTTAGEGLGVGAIDRYQ